MVATESLAEPLVEEISAPPNAAPTAAPASDTVWSFRGYQMRPPEFNTAMVHMYRGEVTRSNTWRSRLDTTTNWAVIAAGAAISFALSDPDHHYGIIILDTFLVTLFLLIEARRYRYYELWSYRVRLLETDFFASMLVPPFSPHPEWAESLAETLLSPQFPISMWEAFGRRFRRNYVWIFLVLALAWALKGLLHPTEATSIGEFIDRSTLGPISGEVMLLIGMVYNGALFAIGLATAGLNQASGEVLSKYDQVPVLSSIWKAMEVPETAAGEHLHGSPVRPFRRRQQLVALVICTDPTRVADMLMEKLKRGVTALHGAGMFTHQERDVLMVAVTVTEIAQLKAAVRSVDANAFIVVMPAQEVLGRGFKPLS